jgi:hypothetical protein
LKEKGRNQLKVKIKLYSKINIKKPNLPCPWEKKSGEL